MEMIKKFWKSVKAFFRPFSNKEIPGLEQHFVKEETKVVRHTPRKAPRKKPNTRK